MTTDPAHRDYARSSIIAAFGEAGEEAAADEEYAAAVREHRERQAAFARAMAGRVTEIAGVLTARCSAILPDGVRFTFEELPAAREITIRRRSPEEVRARLLSPSSPLPRELAEALADEIAPEGQ